MEATSVGLAVVATSVGGVPQVLTDGVDALIVPPGQPDALADALERVCCDPELRHRLGRAARARSSMFDVAKATRQIEDIYQEIVAPRT
jgi:glycosyltransferase involved in cell wall biosynthesis